MKSGTWNIRSIYVSGSLTTVARALSIYKLDLVGVQVRWENEGTVRTVDYTFSYGNGNETKHNWQKVFFFVHYRRVQAVKTV